MQIVIEIPDGYVKVVMENQRTEGTAMDKLLRQAVIDGTQLPKGHGRLKDENEIKRMIREAKVKSEPSKLFAENIVRFTPTILEADRGDEE